MRQRTHFPGGIISELDSDGNGNYVVGLRGLEGVFKVPFIKGVLPEKGDRVVMDASYKGRFRRRVSIDVYRNGEYIGSFKSRLLSESGHRNERQGRNGISYGSWAPAAA